MICARPGKIMDFVFGGPSSSGLWGMDQGPGIMHFILGG